MKIIDLVTKQDLKNKQQSKKGIIMSEDYYRDGFDTGYSRRDRSNHEEPKTDGDKSSFKQGRKDGERRRKYQDELAED